MGLTLRKQNSLQPTSISINNSTKFSLLGYNYFEVLQYLNRVSTDGGVVVDRDHPEQVFSSVKPFSPSLVCSSDGKKESKLYNILPTSKNFTVNRDTTKWVLGKEGYLVEVPVDTPAIEFNADGSYKGVLVEPAGTNICKQSENINTTWNSSQATPTQSTEATPDGDTSNKYIKFVDNNSGGQDFVNISQDISVLAGQKYTASVFCKADKLDGVILQALDYDGGTDGTARFRLLGEGVLGSASNVDDYSIKKYPNGWYRCSMTWTQGASDTQFRLRIFLADGSNAIVDLDGTSSIFVWGAQVEEGPIATSYIPTTTASVTRNKDDISLTSASSLIGQTEGTLFVEVDWRLTSGTNQNLFQVNDATSNNVIAIYNRSSTVELRMLARANGTIETDQGESSTAYSGIQKIAFAYADNDLELYRNGSSISSDTTGSLAALGTMTDIDLGQNYAATVQVNMWIRSVALFTRRLSDSECETLTTI